MRVKPDCFSCYFTQALSALRHAGVDEPGQHKIMYELLEEVGSLSPDRTPSYNSTLVLRQACKLAGIPDPFAEARRQSNLAALTWLPKLAEMNRNEAVPLLTALKLAVAGNVIDLGIQTGYDIESALEQALAANLDPLACRELALHLESVQTVLIVGDNSGEIVFDQILVRTLQVMNKEVVYAVKSGPVLNDATLEDAQQTGMDRLTEVIETGNDFLGIEWDQCAPAFRKAYREAGLILAKGQANYESLEGTAHAGTKTFFLLKAKCPVVAAHLGVNLGDWILRRNRPA